MPLLNNVEILATGTWPASQTLTMTEEDLEGIVSSFNFLNLGGKIPLKLGHDGPDPRDGKERDPSEQYAMGWVMKIWKDGKKLMAQFDLPQKVYNAIKEKMLKFNSVELLKNVQAGNRQIPWVLDAVALLGTDQPAVGVLREMQASIEARRNRLPSSGMVALSRAGMSSTKEVKKMDEKEIAALVAKSVAEGVKAAVAPLEEKIKLQEQETAKAKEDAKKQKIELNRASINRMFNQAIEAKTLKPAVRASYEKLTNFEKSDDFCLNVDLATVADHIKENSEKIDASRTTKDGKDQNEEEKGKTPAEIIYDRTTKLMASRNQNVNDLSIRTRTTSEVLRSASKSLARAYTEGAKTYQEDAA